MMHALLSAPTTRRVGVGLSVLLLLALAISHLWHPVHATDPDPPATASANGTLTMVKDIESGSFSSDVAPTNVGGTLFFRASDGTHGTELWKSDGTAAGTTMVKDIRPGSDSSNIWELTNVDGTLFFRADDGTHSRALWTSDGTAAGTTMVAPMGTQYLTNVDGTLFFAAGYGSIYGRELWKSDGTTAGTIMVKDIFDASIGAGSGSLPSNFTNVDGMLFFTAFHPTYGYELWKSDGTEAGTTLVKDINQTQRYLHTDSAFTGSNLDSLANVDGTLFFFATDENDYGLWKSDGTDAGTTLVKYIGGDNLTNADGTVFFDVRTHDWELWKSDGTEAGTIRVDPGTTEFTFSPLSMTSVDGTLFFTAYDGTHDRELWKSDGTAAGTTMVKDIYPGGRSSSPYWLTNVDGTLFFTAYDGTPGNTGSKVWRSDGTEAGTTPITDIVAEGSDLTDVDGTLFFFVNKGFDRGFELWKYDPQPVANTGGISGTITDNDGLPLADVHVFAYRDGGYSLTTTGSDGTYTLRTFA